MTEKMKIPCAVLVEGKYDAARLSGLVDTLILTTDGFGIYSDIEKQKLLRKIARERGLLILTDSDAAGFKIRNFVTNLVGREFVYEAFVPAVQGKEKRKELPGKEGLLGVEGLGDDLIVQALKIALPQPTASMPQAFSKEQITYYDLFRWGLSGGTGSADFRRDFLKAINLPPRLSKKALLEVLNSLYAKDELEEIITSFVKNS